MALRAVDEMLWLLAAGALGFLVSLLFSDRLKLSRRKFLLAYIPLAATFLILFAERNQIGRQQLTANWQWGLLAGLLISVFLVSNVRSQPKSRDSNGVELVMDFIWLGLGYGLIDGLFLNVFPVLAVRQAFGEFMAGHNTLLVMMVAALGLLASLLITILYHLGYREYRNENILKVLIGNGVITLAFLVSGSPLAAILSHVIMHVAAVIQGPESTLQLPPHRVTEHNVGV